MNVQNFLAGFFGLEWPRNASLELQIEGDGFNSSLNAGATCPVSICYNMDKYFPYTIRALLILVLEPQRLPFQRRHQCFAAMDRHLPRRGRNTSEREKHQLQLDSRVRLRSPAAMRLRDCRSRL